MIKIILLIVFFVLLVFLRKGKAAVFEIYLNNSDFIEGDTVGVKLTRLGCSVDDLVSSYVVSSAENVKCEFDYKEVRK